MFGRSKKNPVDTFQQELEKEKRETETKIRQLQQRLESLNSPPTKKNASRSLDQDYEPIDPHLRLNYRAPREAKDERTIRAIQKRDRNAFFLSLGGILLIILWLINR